jgi:type IV secretory pathway TraG/TraD family ATPase VirD4
MSVKALTTLIRERTDQIGDEAKALALEVNEQQAAEPHVESLRAEIRNIARSEIGHLFKLPAEDKVGDDHHDGIAVSVLELPKAIEEGAVVCFCLPTLQFPSLAKVLGKVVINDFKAVADAQLGKAEAERRPMYAIFDEFSVFAGEQVLNVINMGRSAGVHAVLATQSVADLGRATPETPDHFIRQVVSSCNNYLVHRLNAPEDAKMVAELIGTKDGIEHTAQIDGMGATGLGSVHRAKTFIVHPDEIKQLPRGQAIFVNKTIGTIQRIKVRLGRIAS